MSRSVAILGAAVVVFQLSGAAAQAVPTAESHASRLNGPPAGATRHPTASHIAASHVTGSHIENIRHAHSVEATHKRAPTAAIVEAPAPQAPPELSYQEERTSQIAREHGDRDFLMVDKALGKVILFKDGAAIFSGAALTGESTADRLPPGILAEKFSRLNALEDKVTPAGRFTVTRSRDKAYGSLLDINEIRGKDWGIAIHQVYLGIPSENRAARLRSPNDGDKHITYGCINVAPDALRFLLKELPKGRATPLYILPQDDTKTAAYFAPRNS